MRETYTLIVARVLCTLLIAALAGWGQPPQEKPQKPPEKQEAAEPEEEDAEAKPKEYTFNPIQAANEMKVGRFYMKGGKFKSAAGRFEEALKWNPQEAEAWFLLGEAREKLKDAKAARTAYEKCIEIAPEGKNAKEAQKRLSKLGGKA